MKLDRKTKLLLLNAEKRWAWIKYQLSLRGVSIRQLAFVLKVKPQTIGKCCHMPYPKMEKALADAIGLTPQELFPDRYDKDGLPARRYHRHSVYCHVSNHTAQCPTCKVAQS